jgi:uroporphyrinogen decarboxylase
MRQAGRYMAEYRAIRAEHSLLEICQQPELAAQVTLQPVHALGVDAAILFADLLLPFIPLKLGLEFVKGEGPVIPNPIRSRTDIERLPPIEVAQELDYVLQAIRLVRQQLPPKVPLIGFAGAPFTLAAYMIEGQASRTFLRVKGLMYEDEAAWHALLARLADLVADFLTAQIQAGAQAVQVFDSWVGALSPSDYRRYVKPHVAHLMSRIQSLGVPVIHFGTATATLLKDMAEAGGTVIGLDWRVQLRAAWDELGPHVAVQGNLDPAALLAPYAVLKEKIAQVMAQAAGQPGHIFNLGHGIYPNTPVEAVQRTVEWVHGWEPEEAPAQDRQDPPAGARGGKGP